MFPEIIPSEMYTSKSVLMDCLIKTGQKYFMANHNVAISCPLLSISEIDRISTALCQGHLNQA